MTYTLTVLTVEARDLVVEALRAEADKRTRVARGAAQHVAADKLAGGKDVRSSAVRVAMLLADAGTLADLADELATAAAVPLVTTVDPGYTPTMTAEELATNLGVTLDEVLPDPDSSDGLSPAAHAAMAQAEEYAAAELADPDDPTIDTGALGEDDPTTDDVDPTLDKALG